MTNVNKNYIDKHWLVFLIRGGLALVFGWFALFNTASPVIIYTSMFLIVMGILDAVNAIYSSRKKHGWLNLLFDSCIDIIAAIALLFTTFFHSQDGLTAGLITVAIYTLVSGIIDIVHGMLSVDPSDRFIRYLSGVAGAIMGIVIFYSGSLLNQAGNNLVFTNFFGSYLTVFGTCSLIYGVDNYLQEKDAEQDYMELKSVKKRFFKKAGKAAKKVERAVEEKIDAKVEETISKINDK